ncbi:MAG: HPP family protein [Bdellovibrionales bacterium]
MSNRASRIAEVMTGEPVTISPDVGLLDALEVMRSWGMRHLPVTQNDKIVGVLSDRDIFRHLALSSVGDAKVRDAMSASPYVVTWAEGLAKIARTMADNKYGCTIVVDATGKVKGIFTTVDAMAILARLLHEPGDSEFHVMSVTDYLNHYRPVEAV